jgi:toxin ParE1/3/4
MSRIRITPLADQDLVEIWYFIAQDDPVAADRLMDLLEEKYKLLADNPHMGPARPDMQRSCVITQSEIICCYIA